MALIDDIKAKQAQTLTELQNDDNLISSLTAALQSKDDQIATLNTQLQAAIAAQNAAGNDTADLQAISDTMDTIVKESTAQNAALTAAVTANTTPAPVAAPAPPPPAPTPAPAAPLPVINSINPANGNAGDQVTITGSNFIATETVSFGTVNVDPTAMSVSADGTSVTATVPVGTGQVNVTVSNSAGASNAVPFNYGSAPVATPPAAPANS